MSRSPFAFSARVLAWPIAIALMAWGSTLEPAAAQQCRRLAVVGGGGTTASKTISPGPTLFTKDSWNTDFDVTSTTSYRSFVATIVPKDTGKYSIKLYLKYGDGTSDMYFDKAELPLEKGKPLRIEAKRRPNANPYQVNVLVGGLVSIGNAYDLSVVGCY